MQRKPFRFFMATLMVVGLLMMAVGIAPASANGQDTCPSGNGWVKVDSSDLSSYPVAGATAYCFKAGSDNSQGCTGGLFSSWPPPEGTCGLSHWSYFMSTNPTNTPTNTPTSTATDTPTNTPTSTATDTPTNTPTSTATDDPLVTPTATLTATATNTPTNTPTSTATDDPLVTPTETPTVDDPGDPGTTSPTATSVPPDLPDNPEAGAVDPTSSLFLLLTGAAFFTTGGSGLLLSRRK